MGADMCHRLNVLHIYCRLRDLHIPKQVLEILRLYEAVVHQLVYRKR